MALHTHQVSCHQEPWLHRRLFCSSKLYSISMSVVPPISVEERRYTRPTHCSSVLQSSTECRFVGSRGLSRAFRNGLTCNYGNYFSELGSAATLEWKPALDNLLLIVSIGLAYIAGIVTPSAPASQVFTKRPSPALLEVSQEPPRVQKEANEEIHMEEDDFWNATRLKLLKGIDAADETPDELSGQSVQLSLQALARGPRLRLLLITLEQLKKQVCDLQQNESYLGPDWSKTAAQKLCEVVIPICRLWMFEEHLQSRKDQFSSRDGYVLPASGLVSMKKGTSKQLETVVDEGLLLQWNSLLDYYTQNYDGNKSIMSNLQATGKAEFYADFLFFLCSGRVRVNGFCNAETFKNHKNLLLEDLVIFVADRVSALYLDLISTSNSVCDNHWLNVMAYSISSTRSLEKFRNEVALNGWLHENFQSVTAMFEDRFDLWTLKSCTKKVEDRRHKAKAQSNKHASRAKERECSEVAIGYYKLSVRRGRELRTLSGWRYYFSLYLEFSDICGPLLRTIVTKLGEGISFLLVILIGRSLGLIYRGIRQSVQWTST